MPELRYHRYTYLGILLLLAAVPAFGQVTLAPTFVYVDEPARYGTVQLTNASDQVQEVFIDFEFGYPTADASGQRYLEYDDADTEADHSLSPWIRSFPERFRIPPKHRRTIRLMIDAPEDLSGDMYWTRMVVTSREEVPPGSEKGPAQIHFEFKQVIPVVFERGSASTDVAITDLFVDAQPRHVTLVAAVDRTGEAPFFGSIDLSLMNEEGTEVARRSTTTEAYYAASTYFTIDREALPAGRYLADVTLRAERNDVRKGDVPAMRPVTRRFVVHVPEPVPLSTRSR